MKLQTANSGDGGSSPLIDPQTPAPAPVVAAPAAGDPPVPLVALPPAATTVVNGDVTEETLKLKAERDELAEKLKRRDTDYSELERTHHEYRQTVERGVPIPVKRRRGPLGVCTSE